MAAPTAEADGAGVDVHELVAFVRGDGASQDYGITTLAFYVTKCSENALAAGEAGALAAVVALLRGLKKDVFLFRHACDALEAMLAAGAAQRRWDTASVEDALDAVLRGMWAHLPDALTQLRGFRVLHVLFSTRVEASAEADEGGAVSAVLSVLRAHTHAQPHLHELGWRVLRNLCEGRPRHGQRAVDGGAFAVVVASLQAHPGTAELHSAGCALMLALLGTRWDKNAALAAASAAGAVGAAVAAVRILSAASDNDDDNGDLFEHALSSLQCLVYSKGCIAEAEAVQGGALEMVLALLPRASTELHAELACNALINLTRTDAHAARAAACGAVEACLRVLRAATASGAVELMCSALMALSHVLGDARAAQLAGAAPLVRAALDAHGRDPEVANLGECILVKLQHAAAEDAERALPAGTDKQKWNGDAGASTSEGASAGGSAADASASAQSSSAAPAPAAPLSQPAAGMPAAQGAADGNDGAAADTATRTAAEPPMVATTGVVSGPDSLRVRLFVFREGLQTMSSSCLLSECWVATKVQIICNDGALVMACAYHDDDGGAPFRAHGSTTAPVDSPLPQLAPMRDVLLRKVPLPGFGLLPLEWVPQEVRRITLVFALLSAAPDALALRRVWTSRDAAAMRSVEAGAVLRLVAVSRLRDLLTNGQAGDGDATSTHVAWCADGVEAAHATVHDVLSARDATAAAMKMSLLVLASLTVRPVCAGPQQPHAAALMLTLLRLLEQYSTDARFIQDNRDHALMWLVWALRNAALAAPIGSRAGMAAFSRAGGVVLLADTTRVKLDAACAAAEGGCEMHHRWVAELLRVLQLVVSEDTGALRAAGGAPRVARLLLDVLHEPRVEAGARFSALMLLTQALLHRNSSALERTEVLAACAASDAPEVAARVLNACSGPEDDGFSYGGALLWESFVNASRAWPGGAAALAARARSADALGALGVARTRYARIQQDFAAKGRALGALAPCFATVEAAEASVRQLLAGNGTAAADAAMAALLAEEEAERSAAQAAAPAGNGKSKGKGKKKGNGGGGAATGGSAADAVAASQSSAAAPLPLPQQAAAVPAAQGAADSSNADGDDSASRISGAVADMPIPPAAASGVVSGPESLRVRLFIFVRGVAISEQPNSTLAQCWEGAGVTCADNLFVSAHPAADGARMPDGGATAPIPTPPVALLRDVLLRKVALPGFGLLPEGWVPEVARCTAVLLSQLAAVPDALALRRLLTSQQAAALTAAGVSLGLSGLNRLHFLLPPTHADVPISAAWSADAVEAALATVHDVLRAEAVTSLDVDMAILVLSSVVGVRWRPMPLPPSGAALMLTLLRIFDAPQLLCGASRRDAMTWLAWAFRMEQALAPRGSRAAIGAFSRAGGAALLSAAAADELAACALGGANGGAEEVEEQQGQTELALRLLHACAWEDEDEDALMCLSNVATAPLLSVLCLRSAAHGTRDAAMALLALKLLSMLAGGDDCSTLLAACAAADVPLHATHLLRECPPDDLDGCAASAMWLALASLVDAWPGGGAALAARARSCDALRALEAARTRAVRAHAARTHAARTHGATEAPIGITEMYKAELFVRQLVDGDRAAAAAAAAASLLAEEEAAAAAAAAAATTKARRKAEAKAKRAEAAAAAAAAAAEAAAAQAAAQAVADAARNAAAQAAAQARATAAEAAAQARSAAAAAAQAALRERAAAAAEQQQQRQRASEPPPLPPPPPVLQPQPQPQPQLPQPPPPEEERASDALLVELFPWMRMHDEPPPPPPPAAPVLSGRAGGSDENDDDDGDDGSCAICMDAARDTALVPCGHALLCGGCAARVLATAAPACPVCRVTATGARAA
jgi:hypothetical protein